MIVLDLIGCTLDASAQWRAAKSIAFPNLLKPFDSEKSAGADAIVKGAVGTRFSEFLTVSL